MNDLIIRKCVDDDFLKVTELMQTVQDFHHKMRCDIHKDNEIFEKKEFDKKKNDIVVATLNDEVIGVLIYLIKNGSVINYVYQRKVLFVDALVVDSNYRRLGIGKSLMDEAFNIARENDCVSVELNVWDFNSNAKKFYDNLGMSVKTIILEKEV